MSDSTHQQTRKKATKNKRPEKPYRDFPLYAHPLGYWSKKIRGKIHHFGRWGRVKNGKLQPVEGESWKEALGKYERDRDDLYAGRTPRAPGDQRLTVMDLCNRFLTDKVHRVEAGELTRRMFNEYRQTTDLIVSSFGKTRLVEELAAADFGALRARMAKRWGPVRLGNGVTRVRSVFKFATDNDLIEKAVRYGTVFAKPAKSVLRRHKAQAEEKMLEPDQLLLLIEAAEVPFRAMILLGLNVGFGNSDCSSLPLSAIDLEHGWIDFPRPKTGIPRRCPLWPETTAAIREAIAARPAPESEADADIVFLMPATGRRWVRETNKSKRDNPSVHFTRLMQRLDLHRAGVGFYTLRHVFRTVADAARDPVAVDLIMGHTDHTMGGNYRERIEDSRLVAVTDHVRTWLFGAPTKEEVANNAKKADRKSV